MALEMEPKLFLLVVDKYIFSFCIVWLVSVRTKCVKYDYRFVNMETGNRL